ncbi:MAG: S8 family serine peptidase, partial [Planctomycetaceae bacterium]|nr:S8 family serine peptidase [Planctomycetaceae bacterium]
MWTLKNKKKTTPEYACRCRTLHLESLENREMLSVGPLLYSLQQDYLQSNWFEQLEENPIVPESEGIIENEWIVQIKQESLKNLSSVSKAADYLDDYGVTVLGGLGSLGTLHVRIDVDSPELQNEILSGISSLEYYEQNYAVALNSVADVVNDPIANAQWYLDTINVLPAWEETTGEGVVVVVIDSGLDIDHPDLQANVWTNQGETPGNGIDDDGNGFIDDVHGLDTVSTSSNNITDTMGHGTKISGIIGAVGDNNIGITGIAPSVTILPINVSWGGTFVSGNIIRAINYAIMLKTEYGVNIKVINASFGSNSTALKMAVTAAGAAGIVIVAGAGNGASNNDIIPFYPSSHNDLENVISVAATDKNDLLCSFSNYGINSVDLAAPGSDLCSTSPEGSYSYLIFGTSHATPMVTATVALLAALHPNWTPAEIKAAILDTVDPLPSLDGKVKTGGRLNVGDAITQSLLPPEQLKPKAPSDLSVTQQTNGDFTFKWKDNSKNETSFELQQS